MELVIFFIGMLTLFGNAENLMNAKFLDHNNKFFHYSSTLISTVATGKLHGEMLDLVEWV